LIANYAGKKQPSSSENLDCYHYGVKKRQNWIFSVLDDETKPFFI
jgi:hypothetical protein